MNDTTQKIIVSLFFGFIGTFASEKLHSAYLAKFLTDNLLMLLIAVLAINATTVTVLIDKIGRIQQENPQLSFEPTRKEIRKSIIEQIILISVTFIVLICASSDTLKCYPMCETIAMTILTASLIYDIYLLWDAVNGVFVIDSFYKNKAK